MSDEGPESLVLRYLRNIDRKLDRVIEELHDLKGRVTALEEQVVGLRRDIFQLYEAQVRMQHTLDRHGERLDRIERRLELLPA